MPIQIAGLEPIIDDFDLFLIDQYGVLHNGIDPYPQAVDTLEKLKLLGKHVVIVSNSGKRSSININRIEKLGFSDSLFDHFITSGEVAFSFLQQKLEGSSIQNSYLIARDNDISAVADLGLHMVDSADKADLIVISASEAERFSEDDYRDMLRSAAKNNILCICTNPDKKMLTPNGLKFGAGRIAEIYQELGGKVEWIGKPFPSIYKHILNVYTDCEHARTLCIGDSIEHDIAGGRNASLKTLLVKTGILTGVSTEKLQYQFQRYKVSPDYIAPELVF